MSRSRWSLHGRGSRHGIQLHHHRPCKAASVLAALFAVGLVTGFTVAETADHAPRTLSESPSMPAPNHVRGHDLTPSTPPSARATPVATTSTRPGAQATASPSPAVAAESVTASPPAPCTPGELSIATVTTASSYPEGVVVDITTELQVLGSACRLPPVRSGPYSCGTSVVVRGPAGSQVWPVPGQAEQCADPATGVLQPGYGVDVTVAWNEQDLDASGYPTQAAPGEYQAFGSWSWSAGAGQPPYSFTAASIPFVIR